MVLDNISKSVSSRVRSWNDTYNFYIQQIYVFKVMYKFLDIGILWCLKALNIGTTSPNVLEK